MKDQTKFRDDFVEKCQRNEWEAASQHAWSVAQLNKALAPYQKEAEKKTALEGMIAAIDALPNDQRYTKQNRESRKAYETEAKALQAKADNIKPFITQIQSRIGQFYQEQTRWRELGEFASTFLMPEIQLREKVEAKEEAKA